MGIVVLIPGDYRYLMKKKKNVGIEEFKALFLYKFMNYIVHYMNLKKKNVC